MKPLNDSQMFDKMTTKGEAIQMEHFKSLLSRKDALCRAKMAVARTPNERVSIGSLAVSNAFNVSRKDVMGPACIRSGGCSKDDKRIFSSHDDVQCRRVLWRTQESLYNGKS